MSFDILNWIIRDKTEICRARRWLSGFRFELATELVEIDFWCLNRSAFRPPPNVTSSIPSTLKINSGLDIAHGQHEMVNTVNLHDILLMRFDSCQLFVRDFIDTGHQPFYFFMGRIASAPDPNQPRRV